MLLSERTERALDACQDAVLTPQQWPQALQLLADSFGAASCTFCYSDDPKASVPVSSEHEEFAALWLRNQSHAPDPHMNWPRGREQYSWIIEDQISTTEERRISAYHQETARPGKREWFAATRFIVDGRKCCIPLYRGSERGPFTVEDAVYFARAGPGIARVVSWAEKFAAFDVVSKLSALERVRCAAIVIDEAGRAKYLNASAEQLLGDDFNLVHGRPAAHAPASNRRLQELVARTLRTERTSSGSRASTTLSLPVVIARDETPWLLVEAMPLTALGSDLFSCGRVVLLLTDLTSTVWPDARVLSAVFGLTPAEARLAVLMASGIGVNEAAASIGAKRETVRTQLRMIFAKTNTRRQAELAGLLARLRSSARL